MAQNEGGEKTEKASPKKRKDERKKGNVFTSKDLTTVVSLVTSFYVISFFITSFIQKIQNNYRSQVVRISALESIGIDTIMEIFREAGLLLVTTLLPAIAIIGVVTFLAASAQTRFLFSTEQLKFKLERISLIKGFKRLLSLKSLVELVKSLIKIAVLTWLLYGQVKKSIDQLPNIINWEIMQAVSYTGSQILSLIFSVALAFGAVAALDFLYQWWEYEKNIKMTKQEVKDEYKQMEGNPEIKGARRQKQREYAMGRMMQQVKESDVVVRNPTHYAVALKYTMDVDPAPIVLAKGADNIALKIVEEAEKYEIATVENKSLARGLYEAAGIDDPIPGEFFQPVAELLAWLYSTKEKK